MRSVLMNAVHRRLTPWTSYLSKRCESQDLQYDLSEDIIVTAHKKVKIIGINLPEFSNALDDSALDKLNRRLKEFNSNDQYTVAILHGMGGNFCKGIQKTADEEKAKELIKTMSTLKKPTIASMNGYSSFFGFQLAVMCDFRVMEAGSVCGFGLGQERCEIYPEVCRRLLALTNLTTTLDFVLTGGSLNNSVALSLGLINRCTETGTGLGTSLSLARSIAKFPLEEVMKQRNLIYSCVPKNLLEPE